MRRTPFNEKPSALPYPPKVCGRRREQGMTFVELMFAAGIAAVALSMVFASLLAITRVGALNESRLIASTAVNSILEDVRSMPYEELLQYMPPAVSMPGRSYQITVECSPPVTGSGVNASGVPVYPTAVEGTVTLPVAEGTSASLPDPFETRVILTWYDDAGRAYQVRSATLRGNS